MTRCSCSTCRSLTSPTDGAGFFRGSCMDGSPPNNSTQTMDPAAVEMNAARHSIVVKAPIGKAYEQWSRVEDLPKFITPLRNAKRMDETHLSYTWHPNANEQQSVFQIVLRIPERRIACRAPSNAFMSGVVCFEPHANEEMDKRFVTVCERAMTTTVNDIEHIESQSYNGVSVIKVFFHEGAKVEAGVAQITSICQTLLRIMPPGTTPPLIIQYSASNVPILQVGLSSKTLSEQQLYDIGLNFIRTQL